MSKSIKILLGDNFANAHLPIDQPCGLITAAGSRKNIPNSKNIDLEVKSERLNLRCSPTTKQRLQWIRDCSNTCKYMSDANIIEYLVDQHVIMQELYKENHVPYFKKKRSKG